MASRPYRAVALCAAPALMLAACSAILLRPQIEHSVDEKNGQEIVRLTQMIVETSGYSDVNPAQPHELSVWLFGRKGMAAVAMTFDSVGNRSRYDECHTVTINADGKPVLINETVHKVQGTFGVREQIQIALPASEVRRLTTAEAITGTLCDEEFTFSDEQLDGMQRFLDCLERGVNCNNDTP